MAKRREDVDWYVEMSEMLERRERRRKWLILAIAVAVPLLLMATLVGFAVLSKLDRQGRVPAWLKWIKLPEWRVSTERTTVKQPETFSPVTVKSFQAGDIIYSQLDRNGFVTSISHFFRELGPATADATQPFIVNRSDEYTGRIVLYRLRNVGTGEVFEFENVAVNRLPAGAWIISDEGQRQIRDQLQARMRVQIRRIGGS